MANTKISALSSATTPLSGSEIVPVNQSGVTDSVSVANLTAGRAVSMSSATISGLTSGRVTFAGTSGLLQDSANFTYNGTQFLVGQTSYVNTGVSGQATGVFQSLVLGGQASGGDSIYFRRTGTAGYYQIQTTNGGASSGILELQPYGGTIQFGGNIVQDTAGIGINFTANTPASGMTSQNLTWYETGTFTPTLTTDGSPSTTYTTQTGQYTRIGNIVYIQIGIVWSAFSGTGNVIIGGLPFAAVLSNPAKTISIPVTSSTNTSLVNYSLSDFRTSGSYNSLYLYSFTGSTVSTTTVGSSGTITVKGFYFC